jgi:hypothetical protein
LHVVHQQGVVLDVTEAHVVAPSLLIGLLVLDLNVKLKSASLVLVVLSMSDSVV